MHDEETMHDVPFRENTQSKENMPMTNLNPTTPANGSAAEIKREYCAIISAQQQEDPIGSAPNHRRYLLVEVPTPWEANAEDSRHFPAGLSEVLRHCAEQSGKFRFLAFDSDAHRSPAGTVRVFYFHAPPPPAAFFEKQEYVVPSDRLNALVEAILTNSKALSDFAGHLQPSAHVRELFVCTHGTHDACCAKFGYPIYKHLQDTYGGNARGNIRVWRTSHFGGHRHAPTLIDFPEGRYWARANPEMLAALIERKGNFADFARHYRGWGMIGTYAQVAEREIFSKIGWEWIQYRKEAEIAESGDESAQVRIRYQTPGGETGVYEAEVYVSGKVKFGGCGSEWQEAKQYRIRNATAKV